LHHVVVDVQAVAATAVFAAVAVAEHVAPVDSGRTAIGNRVTAV
jgi:hypothetical protein